MLESCWLADNVLQPDSEGKRAPLAEKAKAVLLTEQIIAPFVYYLTALRFLRTLSTTEFATSSPSLPTTAILTARCDTSDVIHASRLPIDKEREKQKPLNLAFLWDFMVYPKWSFGTLYGSF